jgi:hypothetical protein
LGAELGACTSGTFLIAVSFHDCKATIDDEGQTTLVLEHLRQMPNATPAEALAELRRVFADEKTEAKVLKRR